MSASTTVSRVQVLRCSRQLLVSFCSTGSTTKSTPVPVVYWGTGVSSSSILTTGTDSDCHSSSPLRYFLNRRSAALLHLHQKLSCWETNTEEIDRLVALWHFL
jgi:hypothetical protein